MNKERKKTVKKSVSKVTTKRVSLLEPKTYLTINKKLYRAIKPEKAISLAKKLKTGEGIYKVHVIYGKEKVSKRKIEVVENRGKYQKAKEAKQAIYAFLDQSLWMH